MKEFLETTLGRIVLGVIVLGIWGVNVMNISELGGGDDQVNIQEIRHIEMGELVVPAKIQYEYEAQGRDPFNAPYIDNTNETMAKVEETRQEVVLPPITLTGIMEGMAVIGDAQGNTYFVSRNETFLQDIYVMHIWPDSVLLEYQDKKFTLKLN